MTDITVEPQVSYESDLTNDELVRQALELDDYIKGEQKRLTEFLKPTKERADWLDKVILNRLITQGTQSIKTNSGTAYKSTIITPKIVDREKYLDLCMENYETFGSGMLQLGAPQKAAVDEYMKDHEGQLPPGTDVSSFTRVNIRRS